MTNRVYENFDLLVTERQPGYRVNVISAPAGDDAVSDYLSLADWNSPEYALWMQQGSSDDAETLRVLGLQLYDALFAGKVGDYLLRSWEICQQNGKHLRIRLRFEQKLTALSALPWEYLLAPEPLGYLALQEKTPIVRYLPVAGVNQPLPVLPPLSILVVTPNPKQLQSVSGDREFNAIKKNLSGLEERDLVRVERLASPTLAGLQDRLRLQPIHALHFIGHGYFDDSQNNSQGALIFEQEEGQMHPVFATDLAEILKGHRALRLVFLNACESAQTNDIDPFSGLAQRLVRAGLPAVMAMQFAIEDNLAVLMAGTFYKALAQGYAVDAAICEARQAVKSSGHHGGWGTVAFFSRSDDNRLLKLPESDARPYLGYRRMDYPRSVSSLIDFYTESFVGRKAEINTILTQAQEVDGGYSIIEAPPGSGKSALIASVANALMAGTNTRVQVVFYFVREEGQQGEAVSYLQAINSQLLTLLGMEGGVPADLRSLQSQHEQLWTLASSRARAEEPLLLLVDGLDAMATGPGNPVDIVDLLPAAPSSYVRVVTTFRPNQEIYERLLAKDPDYAPKKVPLYPLTDSEIEALLPVDGPGSESLAELATRIQAMTQGNPLLCRFICQQIREKGESVLSTLEANPLEGVEAYFQREFESIGEHLHDSTAADILGLMAISPAGLTPDNLGQLLGLGRRSETHRSLRPIRRFLTGEDVLELSQPQLRELILADLYSFRKESYRQQLLDWCRSYQMLGWPATTPDFVLSQFAGLLHSHGQTEQLRTLMLDETFRAAQIAGLGDFFSSLSDLHLVLDSSLEENDLMTVLRCVVAYRRLLKNDQLLHSVFDAVERGDIVQALRRADRCPRVAIWTRGIYLYVAWEAAEQGDLASVRQMLQASKMAPRSDLKRTAEFYDALLYRVCEALTRTVEPRRSVQGWISEWRTASESEELKSWMAKRSHHRSNQEKLADEIQKQLDFPYPRYRDMRVLPLATSALSRPSSEWSRQQMRIIFRRMMDQEGTIFTYDLASVLQAEGEQRGLVNDRLNQYLDDKLHSADTKWGISERAHSARATALYWQDRVDDAFAELAKPTRYVSYNAGYETITLLSLVNRCIEFGRRERATEKAWLPISVEFTLIEEAQKQAEWVTSPEFKAERMKLVREHRRWFDQPAMDVVFGLAALAEMTDHDTRLAFMDHLSARWSAPGQRELTGIKALIPLALTDGTTLDALLARLFGPSLAKLTDGEIQQATHVWLDSLESSPYPQ